MFCSLLVEVSHDEAKMIFASSCETSASRELVLMFETKYYQSNLIARCFNFDS